MKVRAPPERNIPERLVRGMIRIAGRVYVRMSAGNLEQRSVSSIRDIGRRECPVEVRVVHQRNTALMAHRTNAVGQRSGCAAKVPAGNTALGTERVDMHLASPAGHGDLFAGDQNEARILEGRVARRSRQLIVIGQG